MNNIYAKSYASVLAFMCIMLFFADASPIPSHDTYRLSQALLILTSSLIYYKIQSTFKIWFYVTCFLLSTGILSGIQSNAPFWAILEVSLLINCILIAAFFSEIPLKISLNNWWSYLVLSLCTCSLLIAINFFSSYLSHLNGNSKSLDIYNFISGFDNPRFLGQFITLTLPIIGVMLAPHLKITLRYYSAWSIGIIFILLWTIAIATGTRGTWLGLGVSVCALLCSGRSGFVWAWIQIRGASIGIIANHILFTAIPIYIGTHVSNHAAERLNTSLSAREGIWIEAIDLTIKNPWLGAGPMHFANLHNPAGAHPHQMLLQWSSEWGIPVALAVCYLLTHAIYGAWIYIKINASLLNETQLRYTALIAALIAASAQSMVDGVFVMPYTQMWLAILTGLAYGLHNKIIKKTIFPAPYWMTFAIRIIFSLSSITLIFGIILSQQNSSFFPQEKNQLNPRFWTHGFINLVETGSLP